ncbi:uncharacterized protein LOC144343132 [Saccoglossus kowalevskii]
MEVTDGKIISCYDGIIHNESYYCYDNQYCCNGDCCNDDPEGAQLITWWQWLLIVSIGSAIFCGFATTTNIAVAVIAAMMIPKHRNQSRGGNGYSNKIKTPSWIQPPPYSSVVNETIDYSSKPPDYTP